MTFYTELERLTKSAKEQGMAVKAEADVVLRLVEIARAAEAALAGVQEFKVRWMRLPTFFDRLNYKTREGMTMAHMPIIELEASLRAALGTQPVKETNHG